MEQPLPQFPGMPRMPFGRAYFSPEVDILLFQSKKISVSPSNRQEPTFENFADKELIQRIAISYNFSSTINYKIGPRPILLNYSSLKEIIVLFPHLCCCIHGNEVRTSVRGKVFPHTKEHFAEKFKALVEGKWPNSMAHSWGRFPWVRYAGSCYCEILLHKSMPRQMGSGYHQCQCCTSGHGGAALGLR